MLFTQKTPVTLNPRNTRVRKATLQYDFKGDCRFSRAKGQASGKHFNNVAHCSHDDTTQVRGASRVVRHKINRTTFVTNGRLHDRYSAKTNAVDLTNNIVPTVPL